MPPTSLYQCIGAIWEASSRYFDSRQIETQEFYIIYTLLFWVSHKKQWIC